MIALHIRRKLFSFCERADQRWFRWFTIPSFFSNMMRHYSFRLCRTLFLSLSLTFTLFLSLSFSLTHTYTHKHTILSSFNMYPIILKCLQTQTDDPSVILLSPKPGRRSDRTCSLDNQQNRSYEDDYTDLGKIFSCRNFSFTSSSVLSRSERR